MSSTLVPVPASGPGPVARAGMVTVSVATGPLPVGRHTDQVKHWRVNFPQEGAEEPGLCHGLT